MRRARRGFTTRQLMVAGFLVLLTWVLATVVLDLGVGGLGVVVVGMLRELLTPTR